jgi:hypothetical protein
MQKKTVNVLLKTKVLAYKNKNNRKEGNINNQNFN